ncbi:hypothetical protein SI65_09597 [Aspergillus cristatus]|uniref:Uncharacterized protein n=1 Tax=Aspergillus cristatus TaxID=573508 RepID=A0A1E3B2Q9_ASPCR|nr:hypothetical protein SI65_09597 [Aspergillus cristatus]
MSQLCELHMGINRLLDTVSLTPRLPLTYIGILGECYEIVRDDSDPDPDDDDATTTEQPDIGTDIPPAFPNDKVPVLDEPIRCDEEEEENSEQGLGGKFWLRESFNEDKAEIFKARRGVL